MHRGDKSKTSVKSFRDMYTDEIPPSLQVIPPDFIKSDSFTESDTPAPEETEGMELKIKSFKSVPESEEGEWLGEISISTPTPVSIEDDVDAVFKKDFSLYSEEDRFDEYRGEYDFFIDGDRGKGGSEEGEEEEDDKFLKRGKVPKWKREGIPLCCLCRCVLPEGLPCCPCGGTTGYKKFTLFIYYSMTLLKIKYKFDFPFFRFQSLKFSKRNPLR